MAALSSDRTRMAAGIGTGVVVGGGTTAAAGYAVNKTVSAIVRAAGPRAAVFVPGVGWAIGGLMVASSVYGAVKAGKQVADGGGTLKQILAAGGLGALGIAPAAAQSVVQPSPIRRPGEEEIRRKQGQKSAKKDGQQSKKKQDQPTPAPATVPPPPVNPPQAADMAKPKSEYDKRRESLERSKALLEKNLEKEQGSGFGPRSEAARREISKVDQQLKELAAEQRNNDPFRIGMQIGLPIGAVALGGLAGNYFGKGAVKAAEATGAQVAGQVEKLGRKAGELIKASPKGVIAGTTAGDKAKAVVNEAYKLGGAKSAFPSPGYPNPPAASALFKEPLGMPGKANYIIPAANMAIGGAEIGASFMTDDPTTRMVLRTAGAAEFSLGFFQYKSLATAAGVKAGSAAVSSIEALRNRITRESATGAPAAVAQTRAGMKAALARTAAGRATGTAGARASGAVSAEQLRAKGRVQTAGINASGQVAKARHTSKQGAVRAGADLGVAKAEGAGRVARAEGRAKLGPPKSYKDTWQDSRGRVYHRKDKSVRKPNNDNTRRRSAA